MISLNRDFKTSLPLLIAIAITVGAAIFQYITVLHNITYEHPYSDVLHYIDLVHQQQFFGPTHFSWRIVFTGFITALFFLLPFSVPVLWMTANVLLFSAILFITSRKAQHLNHARRTLLTGILAIIMPHPAFWRGAFLPMLEMPLFFTIWLMLIVYKEFPVHPVLFAVLIFISLWVKKVFILAWLFGIILHKRDLLSRKVWVSWHLPFLLSGALYALILFLFSASAGDAQNNYLLQPERWLSDWASLFSAHHPLTILKSFIASTGLLWLTLPFIKRFYHVRTFNLWVRIALVISLIWVILSLFTVTNAPRLIWPFYTVLLSVIPQK